MCDRPQATSVEFFNSIAPKWDSLENLESLQIRFQNGLKRFGLHHDEHVLDVGCGTGNLTAAILRQLSQEGRITAVDISIRMIEIAQIKIKDSRIQWICNPVENMATFKNVFDRVICYSVWPHLINTGIAARSIQSMLKSGGKLHVWHLKSREAINKIHTEASKTTHDHLLRPAHQTAALLEQYGFIIEETLDDNSEYLVSARKA